MIKMKSGRLDQLADLYQSLTWSEMQELVSSRIFGGGYSRDKAEDVVKWAADRLAPEVAPGDEQEAQP